MKLEEIHAMWAVDGKINKLEAGIESLRVSELHGKYRKMLSNERMILLKRQQMMAELKLEKYDFYTSGPNEETVRKGWKLPPRGKVLVKDAPMHMDADPDIIKGNLSIGVQNEKVEVLKDILGNLAWRSNAIKNYIDHMKFLNGN